MKKSGLRELQQFERLLNNNIAEVPETEIYSSGCVIDTLETSFWCLLNTHSYRGAVNLGMDTDTAAVVTGGLAGLYYGA